MSEHPPSKRWPVVAGIALIAVAAAIIIGISVTGERDSPQPAGTEAPAAIATAPENPVRLDRFSADVVAGWLGDAPLLDEAFVGLAFLTALPEGAETADAVTLCQTASVANEVGPDVPVLVFDVEGNLVASGGGSLGTCEATAGAAAPDDPE